MNTHNPVEILLVEDSPTDAELTMMTLKENHLANSLVWVKDGAEALDFIFARGAYTGQDTGKLPKVILLDLRLPKVDGMEVLQILKSDERTREIPVVVLTSSKEDRDVVKSYQLGANSYIGKPVEFDEFAQKVKEVGLYWLLVNQPPVL